MHTHFFTSYDGALVRYSDGVAVRENYSRTHSLIETSLQLRATLRAGQSTGLGGYPLFLLADDGESLCFDCARENYSLLARAMRDQSRDGWRVVGCDVNWEDPGMYCAHCSKCIPSAYANDEE